MDDIIKMSNKIFKVLYVLLFIIGLYAIVLIFRTWDILGFLSTILRVISPILVGILIVYFVYIPYTKVEELYKKSKTKFISTNARYFSIISIYTILTAFIVLVITFIIPILFASLFDLASDIPTYYNYILEYINNISDESFLGTFDINTSLMNFANNTLDQIFSSARIEALARSVLNIATSLFSVIISLIVSLYIILEREKIAKFFNYLSGILFKEKTSIKLKKKLSVINKVVFGFIGGKGLDSMINFIVVTTILLIFNIEYAILLGIIAGIGNFIPYLGTLIAVIFISIISLITNGFIETIPMVICLLIFQQLDANFIEPRIMKRTLKVHPVLVIISVFAGGALFGVIGMFLAVPVATIIKQLLFEFIEERKVLKIKVD